MTDKTQPKTKRSKAGAVELSEQQLDAAPAAGVPGATKGTFKGVDGLSTEIEVIEFQDGDDLFLRKRPPRTSGD